MEIMNNVMFVSTKTTIITDGILAKLKAVDRIPYYVKTAEEIEADKNETTGVVVYYMNDDTKQYWEIHEALDSYCKRFGRKVICIATKEQYEELTRTLNPENIANFFERPLEMERFLRCVMDATNGRKKKRVMIVDDDVRQRQLVRECLKEKYDVSMANGGTQAITMLSTQECDLVLLDYEMPIVSGPQVMEMIQSLPQCKGLPIVFLTGKNDEASIRRVMELHPAGYLLKSVSAADLLKKVADVLGDT